MQIRRAGWVREGWMRRGSNLTLGLLISVLAGLPVGPVSVAWAKPAQSPPGGEIRVLQGEQIGTLGGAVSVGASGGLGWTTSLQVVPGVAGLEPGLSIGYGGSGYGGLGVGFSLSAGGAISRCHETIGQDERAYPIQWTKTDALCLDGARLVAVKGEHGAAGTEYRLQTSPLVRVVGLGDSTDTYSGFMVYTPDGRETLYGVLQPNEWTIEAVQWAQQDDERIPLSWHVSRVRDRAKNELHYRYAGEKVDGDGLIVPRDHHLSRIEYGLNAQAGTPMTRQVLLEYQAAQALLSPPKAWESPTRVHQGYVGGAEYERTSVLTRVEMQVYDGGAWQGVRQYKLRYEAIPDPTPQATPDRVRLVSLQECGPMNIDTDGSDGSIGGDKAACFAPTRFEWSERAMQLTPLAGFGLDGEPFYPMPPASQLDTAVYQRVGMQVVGDFDGDGDDDILVMPELLHTKEAKTDWWQLWVTAPDAHGPVHTNLATWAAQGEWVNRAGTVVPAEGAAGAYVYNGDNSDPAWPYTPRPPEEVQKGRLRDEKAVPGAWPMNYDGTGGTDVLLGEPVLELAGLEMDPPNGLGWKTSTGRKFASDANNKEGSTCWYTMHYSYDYESIKDFADCFEDIDQSKADYTAHPGIMKGLTVASLRPQGTFDRTGNLDTARHEASFTQTSLNYPDDGHVLLWVAPPLDLNGDGLQDLMFCRSDADYKAVAGQALPMFYGPGSEPVNWVSGTLRYALNVPGKGIDLSNGGYPATADGSFSSEPRPCHYKDSYLVLDLHGDGRQSLLHYLHPHAKQKQIGGIAPAVPEGTVEDPFPKDAQSKEIDNYWVKLREKVWAEHTIGETTYGAFTYEGGKGMTYGPTGLPYEYFMRWQRTGNQRARYSTHQASQPSDEDGGFNPELGDVRDGRLTDWGSPESLFTGGGPSEMRVADINGDGLQDVLMVDLANCYWGTVQDDKAQFHSRACSFQDVTEFGQSLLEQTYEKLAVFTYLNRGDGTFALGGSTKLWDTDLTADELQVLETMYVKGKAAVEINALFNSAWTKATAATRGWRLEFASSFLGDGNGDNLADLGYVKMVFSPNGGWIGDSLAGTYTMTPVWRLGRQGGGLSEVDTPMGLDIDTLVPASAEVGWPGWQQDLSRNDTSWKDPGDSPSTLGPYMQHEFGLAARLMQMDVNHDGREEILFYDHVRGQYRIATPKPMDEPHGNLLVAVTDGLGARTEVDYAPQWTLTTSEYPWTVADLALPYPWVSRPSAAPAVTRVRTDTGRDAGNAPEYVTTQYFYGKSTSDVRRGVSLGIDRRYTRQAVTTPSGTAYRGTVERYDTTPNYDEAKKAYPLAGTLRSAVSMSWGEASQTKQVSHQGHAYSAQAGKKPGTWRVQEDASTATSFELGAQVSFTDLSKLWLCLAEAYDGSKECVLGPEETYQPLTHSETTLDYDADGYGLVKTSQTESAGSTMLSERTFEHHDPDQLGSTPYVLGLIGREWVANEPAQGVGYVWRTSVNSYDKNGMLQSTTLEPDAGREKYRYRTSYTYDGFGHVETQTLSVEGQPDAVTTYGYSTSGAYQTSVTNALGQAATTRWFEGCGKPEQVTNALGQTAVNDIDVFCRDAASQSYFGEVPLNRKTRIRYGEWKQANEGYPDHQALVTTEVEGGAKSYTVANRIGQVFVKQAPALGFEVYTQTRYDALGRAYEVSLPTKVGSQPEGWTRTTYDAHGRTVQITKPDQKTKTLQYDRYVTTATNENGDSSRSEINALGQVVRVEPPADPNLPGVDLSMCYRYGAFGVLREAAPCTPTAAKGPTTLTYDDYGRLIQGEDKQRGKRRTGYTPLGQLAYTIDAQGTTTRYRYDVLGRRIERIEAADTPQQKSAVWEYDTVAPGVLSKATNAEGSVVQVPILDDYFRIAGSTSTIHGRSYTTRQSYDAWGRTASRSYPTLSLLAPVTTWNNYNDLDQVIGLSYAGQTLWAPVTMDEWGHLTEQRYGDDNVNATAVYEPQTGRLKESRVIRKEWLSKDLYTSEVLEHVTYAWYDDGLIRQRVRKGLKDDETDQSDEFSYTPRGELDQWITFGANGQVKQAHLRTDGFGNITESPSGIHDYVDEKLKAIHDGPLGTISYTYDGPNGNVKTRTHAGGTTTLTYDALDRVATISDTQSSVEITYDADGDKVYTRDTTSGRETFYVGAYQEERGGSLGKQVIGRYALGPAHLTRTWTSPDKGEYQDSLSYVPPADHLGSTTLVTNAKGQVQDRRSYDTWGNERDPANWAAFKAGPKDDLQQPVSGYTGTHERKQFGATAPGISGLVDMQARYYDPAAMQFLQPDNVVPNAMDPLSWNARTYVDNAPVAFTDPTGHGQTNPDGSSAVDGAAMVERAIDGLDQLSASRGFGGGNGGGGESATGMVYGGALYSLRPIGNALRAIKKYGEAGVDKLLAGLAVNPWTALRDQNFDALWEYNRAVDFVEMISGKDKGYFTTKDFESMSSYKKAVYSSRNFADKQPFSGFLGRIKQRQADNLYALRIRGSERKLTYNEVAALKIVFKQNVPYSRVILYSVGDSADIHANASVPAGSWDIAIYKASYQSDMTEPNKRRLPGYSNPLRMSNWYSMGVLAHEMTHVWQHTDSRNVGVATDYSNRSTMYKYAVTNRIWGSPGYMFSIYTTEQQGSMVGDIYHLGLRGFAGNQPSNFGTVSEMEKSYGYRQLPATTELMLLQSIVIPGLNGEY